MYGNQIDISMALKGINFRFYFDVKNSKTLFSIIVVSFKFISK